MSTASVINIGICGLGTVGQGVWKHIERARPELEARLGQYKAATPDLPVVLKADASIQYGKVVEVLDVVTRLGISQLGLVTQKLVK